MLELAKILRDIDNLGRERAESVAEFQSEFETAASVISVINEDLDTARARIATAKTSWLTANFDEAPDASHELPPIPIPHTVIAADGSQIFSDKHEVDLCYVLNAASITLNYGGGERPVARVAPELCYKDEHILDKYTGHKINAKLVDMRRTLAEGRALTDAIEAASAQNFPTAALWDGSLIRWEWANEHENHKRDALDSYLGAFNRARELRIPIAGYISDPGSKDFCNSMKVMLCDQMPIDCDKCAHKQNGAPPPCDKIRRLTDAGVCGRWLADGSRSALFSSTSKILREYGEHTIWAFYMDAGKEIVRVEIPEWVAMDRELLDLTHAVCFDQAQKGRGYPVALAEAHEHAVIHGPERKAFYDAVERSFIKHGARITRSWKRISKGY